MEAKALTRGFRREFEHTTRRGAFAHQGQRDRAAQAAPGAGEQRGLAFELHAMPPCVGAVTRACGYSGLYLTD